MEKEEQPIVIYEPQQIHRRRRRSKDRSTDNRRRIHFRRPSLLWRIPHQAKKQMRNPNATAPIPLLQAQALLFLNPRSVTPTASSFSGAIPSAAATAMDTRSPIRPLPLPLRRRPHPPNHPPDP
ncbi:unnamed protein product [Musa hybrid cultivar]